MKTSWKLLGAVALIGILSIPVCWLTPKGPKIDAEAIRAAASTYDARVIRDQWGVPHIFGKTDADATFGYGYAHAEDDWKHIQESLIGARGMSAQYKGIDKIPRRATAPNSFPTDTFLRVLIQSVSKENSIFASFYR